MAYGILQHILAVALITNGTKNKHGQPTETNRKIRITGYRAKDNLTNQIIGVRENFWAEYDVHFISPVARSGMSMVE